MERKLKNNPKNFENSTDDCVFCKIAKGEISAEKIWEDEEFIAFSDANPKGEGHSLVIPKKHFETLMDLDENTSAKYVWAIRKTAEVLMSKYDCDGFNVVLNSGESAGQIVRHVHFHLLPRKQGDNKRGIFLG